jgi:glycine C-acetyltransferase
MKNIGFDILDGIHPIVPIMLYESLLAQKVADEMLKEGIYVIGFYFPVVPKGKARIRVQISSAMNKEHLDHAINGFEKVGKKLGIIKN